MIGGRGLRALLVAGLMLSASPSLAEKLIATGKIEAIDAMARSFALSGGQTFAAGPKVKLSKRKIGDDVIVVYEVKDDFLFAVDVRRVPFALQTSVPVPEQK